MKDKKGITIRLGNRLKLSNGDQGLVVCNIDSGDYSNDYPESDWGYLTEGILVVSKKIGLVHYTQEDVNNEGIFIVN
jgi:hypothetical protein